MEKSKRLEGKLGGMRGAEAGLSLRGTLRVCGTQARDAGNLTTLLVLELSSTAAGHLGRGLGSSHLLGLGSPPRALLTVSEEGGFVGHWMGGLETD